MAVSLGLVITTGALLIQKSYSKFT